ncbi:MAG: Mur ligase family protein [Nannocystaceae bacterium]
MTEIAARALIGPNLYDPGPAAVAELRVPPGVDPAALPGAVLGVMASLSAALGWPAPTLRTREFRGGLAFAAPCDGARVEATAALLERSLRRVLAPASAADPATDVAAVAAALAEEAPSAELRALLEAARARDLPIVVDDEALTLGAGARGMTWPIDQLPEVAAVPWSALGRIPIALITGTNGKTTSARMLARVARQAGRRVGNSSTDGVAVDEVTIESGDWTGPGATRMVLRRRDVDLAALEVARGGLLRRGLAIDRADAALITNISDDHLGDYGVDSLATMAAVKAVIGGVVDPRGRVVLGADSPPLRAVDRGRFTAPVVWFARSPDDATVRAHLEGGGEAWYVADGCLVEAGPGGERPLVEVAAIPCTLGGAAAHNVLNALGVAALARALALPTAAIVGGLRSFASTAAENPGRINRYVVDGRKIVLDFAHNLAGIRALAAVALHLRGAGRLTVAFGMAGDRSDAELLALADALAELRPDRVILRDQLAHLRGRALGEVPALLRRGLLDRGLASAAISDAADEVATLDAFLADARDGDLLLILAHTQRAPVLARLEALGAAPL